MPDFTEIVKRTYYLIKKNKWLFVYGLVLATVASGGSYSNLRIPSDSLKDWEKVPEEIPQEATKVLGVFTSTFTEWLGSVTWQSWFILVLSIISVLLVSVVIRIVMTGWAKGALIAGFDKAYKDQSVDLRNTTKSGFASAKSLIIFSVLAGLIGVGIVMGLVLLWLIVFLVLGNWETLRIIWAIAGGIAGAFTLIYSIILLTMINVYAERLIVLHGFQPMTAWKKALSLSRNNFLMTFLMGLINSILGSAIGCVSVLIMLVIFGIPAFIVVLPSITAQKLPSIPAIIFLVFLFIIFAYLNFLVQAVIVLFKYGNWGQIFEIAYVKVEGGKIDGK
jgi:hypothetical protein